MDNGLVLRNDKSYRHTAQYSTYIYINTTVLLYCDLPYQDLCTTTPSLGRYAESTSRISSLSAPFSDSAKRGSEASLLFRHQGRREVH